MRRFFLQENAHYEGYEAGSFLFFPNEFQVLSLSSCLTVQIVQYYIYKTLKHCYFFQELQTNEPATPTHIMSYIDILQVLHIYTINYLS